MVSALLRDECLGRQGIPALPLPINVSSSSLPSVARDPKATVLQFVATHGRIRFTIVAGGALAALGTVVPFAHLINAFFGEPCTSATH